MHLGISQLVVSEHADGTVTTVEQNIDGNADRSSIMAGGVPCSPELNQDDEHLVTSTGMHQVRRMVGLV